MTNVEKGIVIVGVTGIALMLYKYYSGSEKKSHFVDEELSDASGKKNEKKIELNKKDVRKTYKPNAWAKINNKWVWVNAHGDLVF